MTDGGSSGWTAQRTAFHPRQCSTPATQHREFTIGRGGGDAWSTWGSFDPHFTEETPAESDRWWIYALLIAQSIFTIAGLTQTISGTCRQLFKEGGGVEALEGSESPRDLAMWP
jgi:hypothetical protein